MSRFRDYVTNTGFLLHLTKAQLQTISNMTEGWITGSVATYSSLEAKGIIAWADGKYYFTPEGQLFVKLLDLSGLINPQRIPIPPTEDELKEALNDPS